MSLEDTNILIRMEETPNPMAVKLVANIPFIQEGKTTFTTIKECEHIPLFKALFLVSGICQIHVFENQITLSHDNSLSFKELETQSITVVKNHVKNHPLSFEKIDKANQVKEPKDLSKLSEQHRKVEEVLNRTIRPYLQADGGDLEVLSVEGDKVRIAYEGACGGCPSAFMGTLESIENILKYELQNENLEVYPV